MLRSRSVRRLLCLATKIDIFFVAFLGLVFLSPITTRLYNSWGKSCRSQLVSWSLKVV